MNWLLDEEKVFKDPVHKYIYVQDRIIWDLINSKEFQRLRRIRQLGTSYFTFHGAEHSRFNHSLGVYEITRKIIQQFERNAYPDWPVEERLISLCAALLHDLGHGPFSHSIEPVLDMHHEQWTIKIIEDESTEVNQILRQVSPYFPGKVADIIRKKYDRPIVVSLISSQMDADRMDYLLRDAYYTGVHYGTFDLDRILRVVRPFQGRIVVKESGKHAVEDYLMSRYHMYWQVYFHPVTRSSESILRNIFRRAKELYTTGYTFEFMLPPLAELFSGNLSVDGHYMLDEAMAQTALMQWSREADPVLADLCQRFSTRKLFKYASFEGSSAAFVEKVERLLESKGLDPRYYMVKDAPKDLPYDVYVPDAVVNRIPILILTASGELEEISTRSDIVQSISGLQRGKSVVYYPEELEDELHVG
jgi:HD superfamily phosphohydrolase